MISSLTFRWQNVRQTGYVSNGVDLEVMSMSGQRAELAKKRLNFIHDQGLNNHSRRRPWCACSSIDSAYEVFCKMAQHLGTKELTSHNGIIVD